MKKKMKSMKWLALMLAMLLVMSLMLTGCGAKSEEMAMETTNASAPKEEMMYEDAVVEEAEAEETGGVQADELGDPNRKLIKRYYLNVETREYDTLIDYIESSVAATGGYIESSNLSGTSLEGSGNRYAYYVLRVPVADATSFIDGLEKNSHVTNKSEEVDDVTLSYVDTQSRIESLRLEQDALMKMLEQADNLETILGLQSRLTEVRYEIESYESQIRSYDNLIEYTTITVDINEVKRETVTEEAAFGDRVKNNFAEGFDDLGEGLENFAVWFAGAVPALLFALVVGFGIAGIVLLVIKIGKRNLEKEMQAVISKDISKDSEKDK